MDTMLVQVSNLNRNVCKVVKRKTNGSDCKSEPANSVWSQEFLEKLKLEKAFI